MYKINSNILLLVAVLITAVCHAQERKQTNDTLDGQVVNVVKPYVPQISDAFKVKEIPSLDDDETAKKKEIKNKLYC